MEGLMEELTKDQLENLQIQKENEYRLAMDSLTTVELQDLEISKKIAQLQLDRKNLSAALIQGKHNIRRANSELRNIKTLIYKRLSGL
jgi:outer membrane murein-binding lipoprotein Lpp